MNAEQIATLVRRGFRLATNGDGYVYRGIGNDTFVAGWNGGRVFDPAGWDGPLGFIVQSVRNGTADTTVVAADAENAVNAAIRFAGGNPNF